MWFWKADSEHTCGVCTIFSNLPGDVLRSIKVYWMKQTQWIIHWAPSLNSEWSTFRFLRVIYVAFIKSSVLNDIQIEILMPLLDAPKRHWLIPNPTEIGWRGGTWLREISSCCSLANMHKLHQPVATHLPPIQTFSVLKCPARGHWYKSSAWNCRKDAARLSRNLSAGRASRVIRP